ncbi:uncharacterized protein LOC106175651 [Lingula anatina]|uniref:Uncharacterized protein LOC106175651 n=1 Tax=Lingula anatina TaxID=7574 RepID=A0A1S3ICB2_LINAN|nr:uncharacterized protein LOC106175651 [Lingula anatina]|eukprot:XP_013395064.1 uncharacterized protein LOC106175651 [Lingula anatina]
MICSVKEHSKESVPVFWARGRHYDVGYRIGQLTQDLVQECVTQNATLQQKLLPFYNTQDGHRVVQNFLNTTKAVFPQYIDELKGTADGAKVSFIELFLYHIENELKERLNIRTEQEGCTDILINLPEAHVTAHSEDVRPSFLNKCFIVQVVIVSDVTGEEVENFTAFTYPGSPCCIDV